MAEGFFTINGYYLAVIIVLYLLSQRKAWRRLAVVTAFIPASLIVGLLASVLVNLISYPIDFESFSTLAFHIFNLSVIAMGLTSTDKGKRTTQKTIWGGIWMTAIFTVVLCLQSLTGYGVVAMYNTFTENVFFEGYGILSGHGFAQGSGHSMAIGSVWETKYNLIGAVSIGLTFSALGYLIAVVVGIPFTKLLLMKNKTSSLKAQIEEREQPSTKILTSPGVNLAAYIRNILMIILVYSLSILVAFFLRDVILRGYLKEYHFAQMVANIIMGLIFVIGLGIAILVKSFLGSIHQTRILNNSIQKKYTSILIDVLIISTFLSIEYAIISQVGVPIVLIVVLNTLTTCFAFYLVFIKSKAPHLNERIAGLLGATFGSLANGLILLKILDPKIKSPVYYELALMNFYSAFTLGHIMLIIFAIGAWNNLHTVALIYMGTLVASLCLAYFVENKLKK